MECVPAGVQWMQKVGDDLLFTAIPRRIPSAVIDQSPRRECNLFQFTRANRGVAVIADSVGPFFLPSPDGARILIEKIVRAGGSGNETREMQLINANGSSPQTLLDLTAYGRDLPMWPSWRNNEEIAFASEPASGTTRDSRIYFDAVLYRLDTSDKAQLTPERTLSKDWPIEMKPSRKAPNSIQPDQQP
jgi:hypothetical protein